MRRQKKRNEAKKRKLALIKRNSKYFNGNFSATGCCKNCLKTQLFLIKVTTGACRPRTPCCLLKNFLILHNKYYHYIYTFFITILSSNYVTYTILKECNDLSIYFIRLCLILRSNVGRIYKSDKIICQHSNADLLNCDTRLGLMQAVFIRQHRV